MKILVVGGFLGSGKTTFINTVLIDQSADRRIALLINEYGDRSVDSELISRRHYDVTDILGGCVCCTLKGKLRDAVKEIADAVNPDLLIIETTGMAVPAEVEEGLHDLPDMQIACIVCVAPEHWRKAAGRLAVYDRQIARAERILVTMNPDPGTFGRIRDSILEKRPEALVTTDPPFVFENLEFRDLKKPLFRAGRKTDVPISQSTAVLSPEVSVENLEKRCRRLATDYGSALYRMKGLLLDGNGDRAFQYNGGDLHWTDLSSAASGESFIVVIAEASILEERPVESYFELIAEKEISNNGYGGVSI